MTAALIGRRRWFGVAGAALLAAGLAPAAPAAADPFSSNMKLEGTLQYGQTSPAVPYKSPPKYRAYTFTGNQGDKVEVSVTSTNGDAVLWVTDRAFPTM